MRNLEMLRGADKTQRLSYLLHSYLAFHWDLANMENPGAFSKPINVRRPICSCDFALPAGIAF